MYRYVFEQFLNSRKIKTALFSIITKNTDLDHVPEGVFLADKIIAKTPFL
jgi:hypothetical protein